MRSGVRVAVLSGAATSAIVAVLALATRGGYVESQVVVKEVIVSESDVESQQIVVRLDSGEVALGISAVRCLPCLRDWAAFGKALRNVGGRPVIVAPTRDDAQFFHDFMPDIPSYAVDEAILSKLSEAMPAIVRLREGKIIFHWVGVPTATCVRAAAARLLRVSRLLNCPRAKVNGWIQSDSLRSSVEGTQHPVYRRDVTERGGLP